MKTALITGASFGIGASLTEALLHEGWKVYGLSRTKPTFASEHLVWLECDLSDSRAIAESLHLIAEPTLDLLISNAGVIYHENASKATQATYEKTFSVNVLAPMLIVRVLRERLRNATIISVSSVSDRLPEYDIALYCCSKAANTMYFNTLAQELTEARVFSLLPDYVDTPMLHRGMDGSNTFDWSAVINVDDMAQFTSRLIAGEYKLESGTNIIIVSEKLKRDLQSVEKLCGYNTDTRELSKL